MRRIKLTRQEKEIEDALLKGEYISVGKDEFKRVANMLEARKKDAVLNIRVNSYDLEHIKQKARKLGIKYQTFISEILHKVAQGV
jgi:predicted DNA binding CopG/RHH family protein